MTTVKRKPPRPYREKTPVLCFYEYVGIEGGITRRGKDSVMIEVEFADQIEPEFDRVMGHKSLHYRPSHVGPRPIEWTLLFFLTPSMVPQTIKAS